MPPRSLSGLGRRYLDEELRWAIGFVVPYRGKLAIILACRTLGTGVALALPYLSKLLVDDALIGGSFAMLVRIVALFLALTILNFALNVTSGIQYARTSADVLFDMRLSVYRHLQRLSPSFYSRTPLGEIVSRINNDVSEIQRVVSDSALSWLGHLIFLLGAVAAMVWLDARLFLVAVAVLPLSLLALVRYRRRLEGSIREMRERSTDLGSFLIETLQGSRVITASNAQRREADRFRERNDAFIVSMIRMQWLRYLSGGLPGLILAAGTAAVFLYGGGRVISGSLSLGTFVAFMAYQMRLMGPINGMMGLYASVATVRVSLRRVHDLLRVPVEVTESPAPIEIGRGRGEIRLESVGFTFGRGERVLEDVDLLVPAGERLALVGVSGSGKSTIADLLVRHIDPQRGRILLDRNDLRDLALSKVRENIVAVDQEPFLFHAPLAENVRYARPEASDAEVRDAIEAAGLKELLDSLPDGLETVVGERGRSLSVGERQRVAVARALLTDPAVIVLDEPTAALDPRTERSLLSGCESAFKGRTIILITHRLELALQADRVIVIDRGRIVQDGEPGELLASAGAFRRLMRAEPPSSARPPATLPLQAAHTAALPPPS